MANGMEVLLTFIAFFISLL